jgi:hypothetical protein
VRDCIIWDREKQEGATPYQLEIINAVVTEGRVSVRGPHGLGKSAQASWLILWFALTRDAMGIDWKVPTTASGWRQLVKFLWPEVHKWSRKLNWQKIGRKEFTQDELLSRNLKLDFGEAFALASSKSELIEGAHATHIMYVFDESKIIPDATWDAAEGALVNAENAYWFSISTPGEPAGRFYDIQSGMQGFDDWWVRHVTLQEAVDAGRIGVEWADQRLAQWGEQSAAYQNKVLGQFAQQDEDAIVPLAWIEISMKKWEDAKSKRRGIADQIGVDVARMGGDKSVIAMRYENFIDVLEKRGSIDTMACAGYVAAHMQRNPGAKVLIDIIGIGAGVYDRLAEEFNNIQGFDVDEYIHPFHVQGSTDFMDETELWEFTDCYSASYWNLREKLDPAKGDDQLLLPPDQELKQELMKFKWSVKSSGKIYVLRKEKVKEELGRSPDSADAVAMAAWDPVEYGMESA